MSIIKGVRGGSAVGDDGDSDGESKRRWRRKNGRKLNGTEREKGREMVWR